MVGGVNRAEHYRRSPRCSVDSMKFEDLLDQVGGFGLFQLRNLVLLALPRLLLPMNFLVPIFLAAVPAHRCTLPGTPANISHQDAWLEAYLPREPDGSLSSCLRFAHPRAFPNTTLGEGGQSPGEVNGEPAKVPCPEGWDYDHSVFSSTIATEVPSEPGDWGRGEHRSGLGLPLSGP